MIRVKTAVLGAVLLASTALAASAPAKAQSFSSSRVTSERDPYYGTDPNYDPRYQDQGYRPELRPGLSGPGLRSELRAELSGSGVRSAVLRPAVLRRLCTSDYYDYDYSDPNYYYTPTYTPLYDPFYDPYCDYYTPPWGFPLDYCRYQTWNQPVYFGGLWYSGPIYYRAVSGVNWYWLNGSWCRDEWRGARPIIHRLEPQPALGWSEAQLAR